MSMQKQMLESFAEVQCREWEGDGARKRERERDREGERGSTGERGGEGETGREGGREKGRGREESGMCWGWM